MHNSVLPLIRVKIKIVKVEQFLEKLSIENLFLSCVSYTTLFTNYVILCIQS